MSICEDLTQNEDDSTPVASKLITVQVGERRFVTTIETIANESAYFAALFSGRWNNSEEDGSYFIDADPDLFEHILRYLRRGVLPLFYDKVKGHDQVLYLALLEEAKYFQIPRLENWLSGKKYLQAVTVKCSSIEIEGTGPIDVESTDDIVEYHPTWQTRKVYVCPRGIFLHRGRPSACGRQCMNARGDLESEYEEEQVLVTLVIRKQILFDQTACTEGRG